MTKIWLTSDHHFGHANIIKYCDRPFKSIQEMNGELITRHNELVAPRDTVYHLGDFAFEKPEFWMHRMHGRFHVIRGNHDKWARKAVDILNLDWIGDYKEVKFERRRLVLMHYPIQRWNAGHHGSIHFHGHSHGTCPSEGIRRIDVGVDCWDYRPVELTKAWLEQIELNNPIEHHDRRD